MIGFNGGLIGKERSTFALQAFPGVWTPREQEVALRKGLWAGSSLLDIYPGATAAFSLRSLRGATVNSAVVNVRRSSDNQTQDFTAAEVVDGTLVTFCGAGNGLVVTWYDQSGSANHATQNNTSEQPRIVNSGQLEIDGGKPTIRFGVVASSLVTPDITPNANCAFFAVTRHTNASSTWSWFVGEKYVSPLFLGKKASSSIAHVAFAGGTGASDLPGTDMVAKSISYWQQGSGISRYRFNNNTIGSLPVDGSRFNVGFYIGRRGTTGNSEIWYGPIQELIYYPASQLSVHEDIITNINAYYNVYT